MNKFILVLLLIALAGGACAYWVVYRAREPFQAYGPEPQVIEIPQGESTNAIGRRLVAAGVVRDQLTFRTAVWLSPQLFLP